MKSLTRQGAMVRATLLGVVLGVALGGCSGQLFPFETILALAAGQPWPNTAALAKAHAGSPGVNLLAEDYLEHSLSADKMDWTLHSIRVRRTLVLDAEDEEITTYELELGKKKHLAAIEIKVIPPGKPARRYGLKDLVRQEKEEGKVSYKFAIPDVTHGTIIDWRREVVTEDDFPDRTHTMWLSQRLPTLRSRITYVHPRRWGLKIKDTPAMSAFKKSSRKGGKGKQVVTYEMANVPPMDDVPFSPYFQEDGMYVTFSLYYVIMGTGYAEAAKTWKAFGAKFKEYFVDNDDAFSGKVAKTTAGLIKGLTSDEQKVAAITKYLHDNVKVAKEYEKRDFTDVLDAGLGSRWQIVGLAHKMLRVAGVDSRYTVIHSARGGHFDKAFISFNEFDAAALMVTLGGKQALLLPYDRDLPRGLTPPPLQGRTAIRMNKDGFDSFFTTAVESGHENRVVERYDVQVQPDGALQVTEEREYHGLAAYWQRKKLRDLKADELKKKLRDALTYADGEVKLERAEAKNLEAVDKPVRVLYAYRITNLIMIAEDEAVMQTAGLLAPTSTAKDLWQGDRRHRPIYVPAEVSYARHIKLKLPASWALQTKLKDAREENKYGAVEVKVSADAQGALGYTQTLKLKRGTYPASELKAFGELLGLGKRLRVPTLVFAVGSKSPAPPAP